MPKSDNQKLKILYILDYLQKNSHQDHPVRSSELLSMLEEHDIVFTPSSGMWTRASALRPSCRTTSC